MSRTVAASSSTKWDLAAENIAQAIVIAALTFNLVLSFATPASRW
jgi:hypothetical protein